MNVTRKAFLPINMDLFNNPKYRDLDSSARELYALYNQRQKISEYYTSQGNTNFVDNEGCFIFFSNEEAAKIMGVSIRKMSTLRKKLIEHNLIKVRRHGLTSFKIYVFEPQVTPSNTDLLVPWGNFTFTETKKEKLDNTNSFKEDGTNARKNNISQDANIAYGNVQKKHINKTNINKTIYTNETSETHNTSKKINKKTTFNSPSKHVTTEIDKLAILSLKDKAINVISPTAWGRILVLTAGNYKKSKNLIDIIFKAKSQVTNKLLSSSNWLYNPVSQEATRFETNHLLTKGLESALIRMTEIIYKGQEKIRDTEKFMYSFIRNNVAASVKKYISDTFELKQNELVELNRLLNFTPKPQYTVA